MQVSAQERSGKRVIEVENISYGYGDKPIVKNFSTVVTRGDRIGILGPNGVGKSTLIKLMLGQLVADEGKVDQGTKLDVAYFDQFRSELDLQKSVRENLAEGTDNIEVAGKTKHVMSYLSDFLFSPDRANSPVSTLSGGEKNRLMLAKLFAKPFNLLVMDEPTNDLDVDTLELLEELLMQYEATLILVSHDRAFLDNVVTSTLVFEGDSQVNEYIGGYEDWLRQCSMNAQKKTDSAKGGDKKQLKQEPKSEKKSTKKLSYKDQRELEQLPQIIEELDSELTELTENMAEPTFYQQDKESIAAVTQRLADIELEMKTAYERWEILEAD